MGHKLRESRGETLVELLAAILIAALSAAMLFTCCMASVEMDKNGQKSDEAFYDALSAAEEQKNPLPQPAGGPVTVTVTGNGETDSIPVSLYGGEDMYSYKKEGP